MLNNSDAEKIDERIVEHLQYLYLDLQRNCGSNEITVALCYRFPETDKNGDIRSDIVIDSKQIDIEDVNRP